MPPGPFTLTPPDTNWFSTENLPRSEAVQSEDARSTEAVQSEDARAARALCVDAVAEEVAIDMDTNPPAENHLTTDNTVTHTGLTSDNTALVTHTGRSMNAMTSKNSKNVTQQKHVCECCSKEFSYKKGLSQHMRGRYGKKCAECGETIIGTILMTKHLLEQHGIAKLGPAQYKCNQCAVVCPSLNSLERHLQTHKGVKPYSCHMCNNSFSRKGYLKKHIQTVCGKDK